MKRKKVIFEEMMTENFLILMSDTKPEIQKAHKRAKRINTKNNNNKKKNKQANKKLYLGISYTNFRKSKEKNALKKAKQKKKKKKETSYTSW